MWKPLGHNYAKADSFDSANEDEDVDVTGDNEEEQIEDYEDQDEFIIL
jgi:hypothetical protein